MHGFKGLREQCRRPNTLRHNNAGWFQIYQPHLVTFVSSGPRLSVLPINSLQGLKTHLTLCASTVHHCGQFQVIRLLLRVSRKTEEEKMASMCEQPMFNRE